MDIAKGRVYLLCLLAMMLSGLIYGLAYGNFIEDGKNLLKNPWGLVTLIDLYVGFLLFIGWIWIREDQLLAKLGWTVAILMTGNILACIYCFVAIARSRGRLNRFFLGSEMG